MDLISTATPEALDSTGMESPSPRNPPAPDISLSETSLPDCSPEEKRRYWEAAFERQRRSRRSAMGFCREEGIPYWKFLYWRRRFREDSIFGMDALSSRGPSPGMETDASAPRGPSDEGARALFSEVRLEDSPFNPAAGSVEIRLARGVTLRAGAGTDPVWLARLAALLSREPGPC